MHKNHFWLRLFFHSLWYRPGAAGSGNLSRALAASLLFAADQWGWFYSTFWAFRRVSPRRRGCCGAAFAGTDEHRRGFEKERREGRVALPKGSASEQQSELWGRNSFVPTFLVFGSGLRPMYQKWEKSLEKPLAGLADGNWGVSFVLLHEMAGSRRVTASRVPPCLCTGTCGAPGLMWGLFP